MNFPELETARLILTSLSASDSEALLNIYSDAEVVKFYDIETYKSEAQSAKLIDFFNARFTENIGIRWAIRLKTTGKLIGTCGFNTWNQKMKNASIGYEIASEYWGFASEALHEVINAAFSNQLLFGELYRIQGDTMIGNLASESVLKKLGFKEEGIRRASGYWKNEFHDLRCYGLLKPEFKQ
ncbi:GNAT family N-acetyltransferase [Pseudoalteromonas sp. NZS11_1]|uniref:GNAT family N-acetyltransferase n=1 Tax=Pseudoalteromonas sp. NZS11_1 TaxID=2792070 RepID=UPI0018CD7A62|nr:GNAT family protein [Pseudoalteromonas sp. NZS11_1]MBH0048208.1 GNAT family N-acetyltransferase [Pseudoalteromonas sp. NZS11_1]